MIRFEAVTKRYPDGTVAVDSLDLVAPTGKITVLVGPSGCGKTTSLRMINRMIEPTSGRVWLNETDTARMSPAELRRGIGYVIQHAGLFPHRTVVDNIATVPRLLGRSRREARRGALELMERVGLDAKFAKRYPAQLSGGQQQRVGVARALAADPPVMLMDEPFSAVDPVVRAGLQDEFLRLQAELGKTIVFVTHDIDEAVKLGDQIAVMRVGGHLAQLASPAELLARPVDDFVAGFVGRDRGYRALGFEEGGAVRPREEMTVLLGSDVRDAIAVAEDGWVLVVDTAHRPLGWYDASAPASGDVLPERLHRGGTVAGHGGTLRALLDAALSSPSGRGVVVDEAGGLMGTVTAGEVVALIEAGAAARRNRGAADAVVVRTPAGEQGASSETGSEAGYGVVSESVVEVESEAGPVSEAESASESPAEPTAQAGAEA
jgi:osmoprotectant transport system ATP-binding protein